MGTELLARGFPLSVCYEELNLSRPEAIAEIHAAYVRAGAEIVETNTFGANRVRLRGGPVRAINEAAVRLARQSGAVVAGSIGPAGVADPAVFREQVEALAGCDLLIVETMRHPGELLAAVREAKRLAVPVVGLASFTFDQVMADGTTPEEIAERLIDAGADFIGANCSEELVAIAKRMRGAPLAMMPSGSPRFLEQCAELIALGVELLGGCCGTTPADIAALRDRARR